MHVAFWTCARVLRYVYFRIGFLGELYRTTCAFWAGDGRYVCASFMRVCDAPWTADLLMDGPFETKPLPACRDRFTAHVASFNTSLIQPAFWSSVRQLWLTGLYNHFVDHACKNRTMAWSWDSGRLSLAGEGVFGHLQPRFSTLLQ